MTDKKRVACFFTCGYTELNAMKTFIRRINAKAEYNQICPRAPKKSRDAIRNRISIDSKQSGLTGDSLIDYVLDVVGEQYFIRESYDAILIEDDKDSRFINEETSTIDIEKWEDFKRGIRLRLDEKGVTIPVIILLAAPEIEAWFVSDWENSFGRVYKDTNALNGAQNAYFSTVFHRYINSEILTDKYSKAVEAYGFFDGEYKKLSEEIQSALINNDFLTEYVPYFEHKPIRYSKRTQGKVMLENIDPSHVFQCCTSFFREGFFAIQSL